MRVGGAMPRRRRACPPRARQRRASAQHGQNQHANVFAHDLAPRATVYKRAARGRRGFMKYRHQYHAGNFADVHKHVLLLEVLRALTRKDKGLLFVDTHAGRGDYDLHPGDRATSGRVAGGRRETARGRAAARGARALSRPDRARRARRQPALSGLAAARAARAARRGSRRVLRNAARRSRPPAQGAATERARARVESARRFRGSARAAAAAGAARLRAHRSALRRTRGFHARARRP